MLLIALPAFQISNVPRCFLHFLFSCIPRGGFKKIIKIQKMPRNIGNLDHRQRNRKQMQKLKIPIFSYFFDAFQSFLMPNSRSEATNENCVTSKNAENIEEIAGNLNF